LGCQQLHQIYLFASIFVWCRPIYLCHSDPTNSQPSQLYCSETASRPRTVRSVLFTRWPASPSLGKRNVIHKTEVDNVSQHHNKRKKWLKLDGHVGVEMSEQTDTQSDTLITMFRSSIPGWLGSRVVGVLDSSAVGPGFKSQWRRCPVTVVGKLFTPIVPLFTKQQNW